jgi:epoxide hydrolase-like predicted phosphatase
MVKAVIFDCTGVLVADDRAVNQLLLAYIRRQLKPHYKIGLLSNLSRLYVERLFTPGELLLFDVITLAPETGIAKPDPRAYHLAAERLQVQPEECIFVDDFARRCEAAREEGMHAVLYANFEQTKDELDAILQEE